MAPEPPLYSKCVAEFVGTFLLVFTVGCNVLMGSPVWAVTSIACVLMVSIYALGGVSGANFNPAVSFALGLSGKMPWSVVVIYWFVQILGGIFAGFSYRSLAGSVFNLQPTPGYGWVGAAAAEMLYTFMLCFVVLNVAASDKAGSCPNQYYGLAIGFVIIAGGYGAGAISGGCFNPAVAIGIDLASFDKGIGWCAIYTPVELVGAAVASALHRVVLPGEYDMVTHGHVSTLSRLVSEFTGTFFLVLTVGLNVLGGSPAGAFSIAASLMCMIYALGNVSGAHFNPAVTLAIWLSGRGKMEGGGAMVVAYMGVQIAAGMIAAVVYSSLMGDAFMLGPQKFFGWGHVACAEIVFTFVLCFVVLSVATTEKSPGADMFGLAIGSCVTVGGCAIGAISGGSLNPAVSFGVNFSHAMAKHTAWMNGLYYSCFEFIGAAIAAGVFMQCYKGEYKKGPEYIPIRAAYTNYRL